MKIIHLYGTHAHTHTMAISLIGKHLATPTCANKSAIPLQDLHFKSTRHCKNCHLFYFTYVVLVSIACDPQRIESLSLLKAQVVKPRLVMTLVVILLSV